MDFCGKNEQKCQICHIYVLTSEWWQNMVFRGLIMFRFSYDMEQLQIQDFLLGGDTDLQRGYLLVKTYMKTKGLDPVFWGGDRC